MPLRFSHFYRNHTLLFLLPSTVNWLSLALILCKCFILETTCKRNLALRECRGFLLLRLRVGFFLTFLLLTADLKFLKKSKTQVFLAPFIFFLYWWLIMYRSARSCGIWWTKGNCVSLAGLDKIEASLHEKFRRMLTK
jgi:hypothetical protein